MRHQKKLNHLSRKRGHRRAMLANMASSLILHKRIRTTTAKAKALRVYVEPLITKAKTDNTSSRREVFSYLQDKEATAELFREVAAKVADRPGGYTRIIKLGARLGDSAEMAIIELVDYNENLLAEKAAATKKSTRRRRGGKKKSQAQAGEDTATETAVAEEASAEEQGSDEEATNQAATGETAAEITTETGSGDTPEATEETAEQPEKAPETTSAEKEETKEPTDKKKSEAPTSDAGEEKKSDDDQEKSDDAGDDEKKDA